MTLPFPVAFWSAPSTVVVSRTWSDSLIASEATDSEKFALRSWSDALTSFEATTINKQNFKSITVSEQAALSDAWSRYITPLTPNPPSNLVATRQANPGGVNLSWTDNSSNETSFVVERSFNNVVWNELHTVGANVVSSTDWATIPLVIPTITAIDSEGDDTINVSWGSVNNATDYNVYTSTAPDFVPGDSNSVFRGQTSGTSFQITGLAANTEYRIIVAATNMFGLGGFSEVTAQSTGPTAPLDFQYSHNGSAYVLTWSNGTRDDDSLHIEISLNSGGSWSALITVPAGSTSYTHSRSASAAVRYRIRYDGETVYAT